VLYYAATAIWNRPIVSVEWQLKHCDLTRKPTLGSCLLEVVGDDEPSHVARHRLDYAQDPQ